MDNEPILLYIVTFTHMVNIVHVVERREEGRTQKVKLEYAMSARFCRTPRHIIYIAKRLRVSIHGSSEAHALLLGSPNVRV